MAYPHPQSPAATISSLSHDDRRTIFDFIPSDCKVIAAVPARIYHSSFGAAADDWASTGLRGMLVFGRNRITIYPDRPLGVGEGTSFEQNYSFRLIDLDSAKGIVWFHPIPSELDYHADKPFFHTFSGAVCRPLPRFIVLDIILIFTPVFLGAPVADVRLPFRRRPRCHQVPQARYKPYPDLRCARVVSRMSAPLVPPLTSPRTQRLASPSLTPPRPSTPERSRLPRSQSPSPIRRLLMAILHPPRTPSLSPSRRSSASARARPRASSPPA